MVKSPIEKEILNQVNRLELPEKRKVLEFVRALAESQKPRGVPAEVIFQAAAGLFDKADVEAMMQAVEKDCESVDFDEW
jgi:hypothetical protein